MTVTLAFYKGTLAENPKAKLFDRLVCWRTRGRFSHCEVVNYLETDGKSFCASSSFRDGGVRCKWIDLGTGRWELLTVPGDAEYAIHWFISRQGKPYDWFGLLGWVVPWRVSNRHWWFCSEACAESLSLPESWKFSPNDLYRWANTQHAQQEVAR